MSTDRTTRSPWRLGGQLMMVAVGLVLLCCQAGWASNEPQDEKGKPVVSRQGNEFTVSLIPRAKSTSVRLAFAASGGTLKDVTPEVFEKVARPEVDVKDFKSELYVMQVGDVPVGGTATITVTSQFFTNSTLFWTFNEHRTPAWEKADIQNIPHENLVQELVLKVTDGGPMDSDNAANGRITVVGGPWDSFWGYALGTLFIRFFGIFLVLSVLMVGMMLSGKFFEKMEKPKTPGGPGGQAKQPEPVQADTRTPATGTAQAQTTASIAAISVALHMYFSQLQAQASLQLETPGTNAWAQQGRQRAMGARNINVQNRR